MNLSSIKENTQLAMETLVAHKFRAALTILGVFIGVLVIVAMAAVLNGFRQTVLDQAESFGTRNVYIWRFPVAELVMNVPVDQGRYFTDSENQHRAYVCVLAFNIVEALFPGEDPLGKTINVGGQEFTVVGTVKKQKSGPFGSENQEDNDVFVPYYTFHKMYPNVDDHFIIVRMREGRMQEGIRGIEQVLRRRRNLSLGQDNNFEIGTPESFISTFDDIVRLVFVVMIIMSMVAFIVGGVGVM